VSNAPTRAALVRTVAELVPAGIAADCVLVGIDGVDGAGKTTFADELATAVTSLGRAVVRISVDDFHHRRAVRYRRGASAPDGFWLDSYDYARLRRDVLEPLGPGGSRRYRPRAHDLTTDALLDLPAVTADAGAVVIVDGLFLHRDELAGDWAFSVFLAVPFAVAAARMAVRDGTDADPDGPGLARYVGGQRLYFAACTPWLRADVVIDNADLEHPVISSRAGTQA
jgi:uridine kinase